LRPLLGSEEGVQGAPGLVLGAAMQIQGGCDLHLAAANPLFRAAVSDRGRLRPRLVRYGRAVGL
jgi:hypothetical protein